MTVELLHVDADVVVVNKPSGMLVHRGWDDTGDIAVEVVGRMLDARLFPVHRLDRATSGALLFARSSEVAAILGHDLAETRAIEKAYVALVRGVPPSAGVIDHAIPRKLDGPRVDARTRFRLVARCAIERCSLVAAWPETGRLHQVRRHLKHITHPLIGDVNYGRGDLNRHYRATYGLHRLALHAIELAFPHPVTRAPIRVTAAIPADLAEPLEKLGLPTAWPAMLPPDPAAVV
ncbi:pseudouridine synthase [Myxococcota bacterium]|nr:pseudouridine synthase [Myxococcota bacterium]